MKKLVIHAGTHKTGTSALQLFATRRPDILSEYGIYYPTSGKPLVDSISYGHHLLAWSLFGQVKDASYWPDGDHSPQRVWCGLLDEIESRPEHTILVSSEELCQVDAQRVQLIANLLSGIDVVPVIYFRRYDEYLQAMYATNVLHYGERQRVLGYLESICDSMDYGHIVTAWRSAFGERLIVKPFFRQALVGRSLICDILACLGHSVDPSLVKAYARANAGVPWNVVECVRVLNTLDAKPEQIQHVLKLFAWLYDGRVSHEVLPPAERRRLIARTLGFFEQEFASSHNEALWSHLRGDDLDQTDGAWGATHRTYSFASRTLLDLLAAVPRSISKRRVNPR